MEHIYTKEEKEHLREVFVKLCEKATEEFPNGSFTFLAFSDENWPGEEFVLFVGDGKKCKARFDSCNSISPDSRFVVVASYKADYSVNYHEEIAEKFLNGGYLRGYMELKTQKQETEWDEPMCYYPYDIIEHILRNWKAIHTGLSNERFLLDASIRKDIKRHNEIMELDI